MNNISPIIKEFYDHRLDLKKLVDAPAFLANLAETPIKNIYSYIVSNPFLYTIQTKDIPQFSDFDDCYISVPVKLANCGLKETNYETMGIMLRSTTRRAGADMKYGENHLKTCALMGLCTLNKARGSTNPLTHPFVSLSEDVRLNLKPKFVLFIPFIQNYFRMGHNKKVLENLLQPLSLSTRNRRKSNCHTLINIVHHAIENEL